MVAWGPAGPGWGVMRNAWRASGAQPAGPAGRPEAAICMGLRNGSFALIGLSLVLALSACSRNPPPQQRAASEPRTVDSRYGTSPSPRLYEDGRSIPRGGGTYKVGAPYQIAGRWYHPKVEPGYDKVGVGSWYGDDFHGRKTANGEIYDMRALTAAHPTLPMPSLVWVTNEANGRSILVRVNDRGPYAHDRIIDLSKAAARALGYESKGLSRLRVRYAGPAPLNGDDRREQAHLRQQRWYAEIRQEPPRPRAPHMRPETTAAASGGSRRWWW